MTVQAICLIGVPFGHNQNVKAQHFLKVTGLTFIMEGKYCYFICNKYCVSTYYVLERGLTMMK